MSSKKLSSAKKYVVDHEIVIFKILTVVFIVLSVLVIIYYLMKYLNNKEELFCYPGYKYNSGECVKTAKPTMIGSCGADSYPFQNYYCASLPENSMIDPLSVKKGQPTYKCKPGFCPSEFKECDKPEFGTTCSNGQNVCSHGHVMDRGKCVTVEENSSGFDENGKPICISGYVNSNDDCVKDPVLAIGCPAGSEKYLDPSSKTCYTFCEQGYEDAINPKKVSGKDKPICVKKCPDGFYRDLENEAMCYKNDPTSTVPCEASGMKTPFVGANAGYCIRPFVERPVQAN